MFVSETGALRNWKPERCNAEWAKLLADPKKYGDEGGPPNVATRLYIPAWMTGEESSYEKTENFESKTMMEGSKPKAMNDDIKEKLLQELKGVFSKLGVAHRSDVLVPLAAGSLTKLKQGRLSDDDADQLASLRRAAGMLSGGSTDEPAPGSPVSIIDSASSTGGAENDRRATPKKGFTDIVHLRNVTADAARAESLRAVAKLKTEVKKAAESLAKGNNLDEEDGDYYLTAVDRWSVAMAFLGHAVHSNADNTTDYIRIEETIDFAAPELLKKVKRELGVDRWYAASDTLVGGPQTEKGEGVVANSDSGKAPPAILDSESDDQKSEGEKQTGKDDDALEDATEFA